MRADQGMHVRQRRAEHLFTIAVRLALCTVPEIKSSGVRCAATCSTLKYAFTERDQINGMKYLCARR